jgi:membrane-associated phospholipid phosphatase
VLLGLRMLTMYLFTFEPPMGIIPLEDPVTAVFYPGGEPFLKDLFFSGHTATLVLFAFAMGPGRQRTALLLAALVVGGLVLVQHVHYTVDVLAAPFFAGLAWWVAGIVLRAAGLKVSDVEAA